MSSGLTDKLILIVENEANPALSVRDWAYGSSITPVFVSSGLEALLWLGKGNLPDAILADAGMEQLNGVDFVKTLAQSGFFHEIPVLVFGPPQFHPVLAGMRQAGAKDHVFLPVDGEELSIRLSGLLKTSSIEILTSTAKKEMVLLQRESSISKFGFPNS